MHLEPKFKALILADIDGEVCPTLCDTGCQKSCISENLLRRHSTFFKNKIQPHKGKTISIDGSKVETIGTINIQFRIKGRFMRTNCRIIKNLIHDFVLGWDFFSKHNCTIHPKEGHLSLENDHIPLIPNSTKVSQTHFSVAEDTVIPPLSKMLTQASFYFDPDSGATTSDTVEVEPQYGYTAKVAVARSISKVQDGHFPIELLNPLPYPMAIKASDILGHVTFTSDESVDIEAHTTEITLDYEAEDSGYESEGSVTAGLSQPKSDHTSMGAATAGAPSDAAPSAPGRTPTTDTADAKPKFNLSMAKDAEPYREALTQLLQVKHVKTFSTSDRDRGKTDLVEYRANIKPGPPISVPPYRATPQMQQEANKIVHEMIADGLVSHSTSPYSAPVLLVPKKLGGWRFVTDFRKVNARCERVVYPLPRIEDALRQLKEPKFFSTMDLQKGFWQVPIAPEDRKYFAFSTGTLHVEYNVMPMGALNSSATMQALMALILRGLPPEHIICFLDDILVASSTMEEHLVHLDRVLSAISNAGLKLNAQKCLFAQDSVSCLGHTLSRNGIGPDTRNLDKIKTWKSPKNKTEIRQFLGLTGYYRQLIKDYAEIAGPLTDLTKAEAPWHWTDKEEKAFTTLRDYLTSDSIMAFPDFNIPFWVKSDASGSSVGYVLTQMHDKKEKVIAYGSKKLTAAQRRYSTYDREYFGILTAIRAYSHYLRHAHFYVITDHRPLLNLKKIDPKTDATGRRVRWSIELNLYDFEVIYKKGKKHSDADAMSRLTDHDDYAEEEEFAGFMLKNESEHYMLLGMDDKDTVTAVELIAEDERRKELASAQDQDPIIAEVKRLVKQQAPPPASLPVFYKASYMRFVIQDNILFRKVQSGPSGLPILQAIIPPVLVPTVLSDAHGSIFAGHPGAQRMVDTLKRHAIWPSMAADCKKHVTGCKQCDRNSQPTPGARTELQPMNPTHVFEHVCCDLIQLPPVAGWKYVCVFMDVFSRHVSLYKLRDKSTASFTRALEDYIAHVGCPLKLTSDNGAEFCSQMVEAVTKILGIKKRTSVVYRPQSQGMVERWNRQLISELRTRLLQNQTTWPEQMHFIAMAHNAAPAARTGESPNLVFFGRELPLPTFTDFSANTLREKSVQEYVKKFQKRVEIIHEAVRAESKARSDKTAAAYNRKVKHTPLNPGELVFYKETPKNCLKTDPKWTGPVEVVKRHPNAQGNPGTTYTLKYKDGSTLRRNYEQLKVAKAAYEGPINLADCPDAVAPRVPTLFAMDPYSEDEQTHAKPTSPVAHRTRSKTTATVHVKTNAPPQQQEPSQLNRNSGDSSKPEEVAQICEGTPHNPPISPIQPPPPSPMLPQSADSSQIHSESTPEVEPLLTDVTRISGVESLIWDTQDVDPVLNASVAAELTTSRPPSHPNSRALATPPAPTGESTNSQGATPDASQNTVVHRSPVPSTAASPQAPPEASSPLQPHTPTGEPIVVAATAGADAEGSGDLAAFEEFLDTAVAEIQMFSGVGRRQIDVILHNGYEYRRDRIAEKTKPSQLWICRCASKFKCKGRARITTRNLDTFPQGAEVLQLQPHNHEPHRVNSYGWAAVTEIQTSDSNTDDNSRPNSHAISQMDERDFSADFGEGAITSVQASSPTASASRPLSSRDGDSLSAPSPTLDPSYILEAVSQADINPYLRVAHVRNSSGNSGSLPPIDQAHDSA